jgi:hypothetical protein
MRVQIGARLSGKLTPKSLDLEPSKVTQANVRHISWDKAQAIKDRCFRCGLRRGVRYRKKIIIASMFDIYVK